MISIDLHSKRKEFKMKTLQVLGPGCANCQKLAALCAEVVTENAV